MTGDEVVNGLAGPPIGNVLQFDARRLGEPLRQNVLVRPHARGAVGRTPWASRRKLPRNPSLVQRARCVAGWAGRPRSQRRGHARMTVTCAVCSSHFIDVLAANSECKKFHDVLTDSLALPSIKI
jgi:hypothetical protein